jgi:serine phosphatase RsbU (regulator of sigma subunit)
MKMIKEESDLNKDIAEVYTKLNDYKNAYDYYQKYSNLKDTIFKEDSQRAITEMATKYETDKKDKENQLLAAGNKIKDSELQRAKVISYFIIFVAVFILLLAFLSYNRYLIKKKANEELAMRNAQIMQQKEEIQAQRDEIEQQRDVVVKQKQEITDSIIYAQRIQKAILPPKELLDEALPNHFIHYKPRDIVSGDFYWMTQKDGRVVITAADCTGHGVPGAFMSMLGVSFLNEIANKPEIQHAHEILNQLRDYVMNSLRQTGKDNEAKDGMDISLSIIDYSNMKLEFAGAYNPLYLIRNNEILELKADKMPIGIYYKGQKSFEVTEMEIQTGDVIYMFSDGYADQFGGDKGRKFMTKNFKELLLQIHLKPMEEQRELLNTTMEKWRGPIHQIDDMLVIGIRI